VERIRALAETSSTVLIRGENGVGKNLVSTLLHRTGPRRQHPLVRVNCAALPSEVVERELLGDRTEHRDGQMAIAAGGTLVVEEIAALSMNAQARLLHAIERKEFCPIGSNTPCKLSARILLSTSVDLERAVARRTFREDFYYRLSIGSLIIAPLRDRKEDIPVLADHFLTQFAQLHRRPQFSLTNEATRSTGDYAYPRNVRELRDAIEHAVLHGSGPQIGVEDLPAGMRGQRVRPLMSLEELERGYIAEVLAATSGRKSKAAAILGISRKTLLEKRKRYRLG
jgi:DNA-binding NtrC family response regulator